MTHTGHDACAPGIKTDMSTDAEVRLARNRGILQQRLAGRQTGDAPGALGALGEIARTALPLARQAVRTHPYASLGGAMLAGMSLMRWKPWRGLGGSFLVGLLARQALAHSVSPGSHALGWLLSAARAGRKPDPARAREVNWK